MINRQLALLLLYTLSLEVAPGIVNVESVFLACLNPQFFNTTSTAMTLVKDQTTYNKINIKLDILEDLPVSASFSSVLKKVVRTKNLRTLRNDTFKMYPVDNPHYHRLPNFLKQFMNNSIQLKKGSYNCDDAGIVEFATRLDRSDQKGTFSLQSINIIANYSNILLAYELEMSFKKTHV